MAACRNGGLTVAASIPRVTCVARSSLPYHTFLICPSDNHMLHSGRPPTAKTITDGGPWTVGSDGRMKQAWMKWGGAAFTPLSYIFNPSFGRL